MATIKISQLSELTVDTDVTSNDLLQIINIEQTSSTYPAGTNRKIKASTLANGLSRLTTTISPVVQAALDSKVSLENFNSAGLKIAVPVVAASPGLNYALSNIIPGSILDGVTLVSGNRVLLKNQTAPAQNGIYVVQSSGVPLRATDFDTLLEINDGYVLVDGGNTLKGSAWVVTSVVEELGTDPINFTQFSSAITNVSKASIGLGNVDNTSDANKPISTATATVLNGKQATITGGATSIVSNNLTVNRALVSDSSGKVAVSAVTSTELGRLSGVTSSIQSQLDLKANLASPTFTGNVSLPSTTKVDGVTISSEFIPVGAVIPFAMNSTPAGWVTCNGAVVNRIGTYADLFNVIGTTYNIGGESSTQFRLPDLRGIFIRGSGSQTIDGTSYSATFGQTVKDAFQKFTGTLRIDSWMKGTGVFSENTTPSSYIDNTGATDTGSEVTFDPSTVARTSNETRPVNIALRYCIKF